MSDLKRACVFCDEDFDSFVETVCDDCHDEMETDRNKAYAELEAKIKIAIEAVEMAIELAEHEHSEDERGWTSMCIDCENERKLREALAKIKGSGNGQTITA